MSVKFNNGDNVRQVMPAAIEGKVVRFVFDETTGDIAYVVQNTDEFGVHERVFAAKDIEAV